MVHLFAALVSFADVFGKTDEFFDDLSRGDQAVLVAFYGLSEHVGELPALYQVELTVCLDFVIEQAFEQVQREIRAFHELDLG